MTILVFLSIALSRAFAAGVNREIAEMRPGIAWFAMAALIALCTATLWLVPERRSFALCAFVVGQLAIAALLAARSQPRNGPVIGHPVSNAPS
jgi:hypothetical protein